MNVKKIIVRILPAICAAGITFFVAACGEDSKSSPTTPEDPGAVSSASVEISSDASVPGDVCATDPSAPACAVEPPESSASVPEGGEVLSSAAEQGGDVPPTPAAFAAERTLPVMADTNGFYDVGDIYKAAPETYRIAFVLRHAARESGLGQESALTEAGVAQALNVGAKLAGGDESFYYASTDFVRTRETCNNIAKGRGETNFETETQAELLNGSYFLTVSSDSLDSYAKKKGGSWKVVSAYAFGENFQVETLSLHFYDLFERGNQFVMENIVANMPNWKRVSVLISHDVLLEPLVVYASNRQATVNFYKDGRWVNYLSGIAVVLNAEDKVEVYPVRGNDVGFMYTEARQAKIDSLAALENP